MEEGATEVRPGRGEVPRAAPRAPAIAELVQEGETVPSAGPAEAPREATIAPRAAEARLAAAPLAAPLARSRRRRRLSTLASRCGSSVRSPVPASRRAEPPRT